MIKRRVQAGIQRGQPFEIEVNGEKIVAFEGETIATAMIAAGQLIFRHTAAKHHPRGVYCGIGLCHECMVVVDGVPNVRACQTPVTSGCRVETQDGLGNGEKEK